MNAIRLQLVTEGPSREPLQLLLRPVLAFVEADIGVPARVRIGCRRPPGPRRLRPTPRETASIETYRAPLRLVPSSNLRRPRRPVILGPGGNRSMGMNPLTEAEHAELLALEEELRGEGLLKLPTHEECETLIEGSAPCWVARCRHHNYFEIDTHTHEKMDVLRLNHPGKELDEIPETCSIRQARRGAMTLGAVGAVLGITEQRTQQIEAEAIAKLKRRGKHNPWMRNFS